MERHPIGVLVGGSLVAGGIGSILSLIAAANPADIGEALTALGARELIVFWLGLAAGYWAGVRAEKKKERRDAQSNRREGKGKTTRRRKEAEGSDRTDEEV